MSRGGYDGDDDFPGQGELWWANYARALRGKRGRKALADLRDALLALPEKRLISGALSTVHLRERLASEPQGCHPYLLDEITARIGSDGEGVCAIGAYVWHQRVKSGMDAAEAFDSLPIIVDSDGGDLAMTAGAATEAGMTFVLAYGLADRNDETYYSLSPEARYEAFMEWLDKELAVAA